MREILFRGKRESDGKWLYGLYTDHSVYGTDFPCIMPLRMEKDDGDWAIISETVGQFTGFTDKNGAKIFEGDILAFDDMDGSKGIYEVFYDGDNGKFAIAASGDRNYVDDFELFERNECFKWFTVIGNIYDSPELLKE